MSYRLWVLAALTACTIWAQPVIYPKGIVDSASFLPAGLPSSGIAQGSIFSIFGTNLGPAKSAQQPSFPLQTTLAGVSITVTQGSTTVNAVPLFVLDSIVNAIMPSNTPLGLVSVQVIYNGIKSNPSPVRVVANSLGLFTSTGTGIGPGSVQNVVGNLAPLNSPLTPAQPGQYVILWGTGLGPIAQPDTSPPPTGNLPSQVEIFVGGQVVSNITYSGRTPCCSGVDEIVFQLPANAPLGCFVPVTARLGGTVVSNTVTIAISQSSTSCTDAGNPLSLIPVNGGSLGLVALKRDSRTDTVQVPGGAGLVSDQAIAWFGQYPASPFGFDPYLDLPAPGSCTADGSSGNPEVNLGRAAAKDLSPGAMTVSGGPSPVNMTPVTSDLTYQFGLLGLNQSLPRQGTVLPLYLNPGTYKITAAGGDIGAFSTTLSATTPVSWTNRPTGSTPIDRTQPFTINWTGSGPVYIRGYNRDYPTNSGATFICNVPAGSNSFTIPNYILQYLPATRKVESDSEGYIELHSLSQGSPQSFSASQLTAGEALVDVVFRSYAVFK